MPTRPLANALKEWDLPDSDVRELQEFDRAVPNPLPDHAVAVASYIEGVESNVLRHQANRVKTRVVAVNAGNNWIRSNVVCLLDGRQLPCNQSLDVARVRFGPDSAAVIDLNMEAVSGQRIDVLLLIEGDSERPMPTARTLMAYVEQPDPKSVESIEHTTEPIYGGCGFVTVVDSLKKRDTFHPLKSTRTGKALWALAQVCEDDIPGPLRLLLVEDRRTVLHIEDEMWRQPVSIASSGAVPVPQGVLKPEHEYHVVALRLGSTTPPSWVSHPVFVVE